MGLILLTFLGLGVSMIVICIPMMLERVPPNGWYGFRTPRTMSDPNIWYPANRVAGRNLSLAGVLLIAATVGVFLVHRSLNPETATIILGVVAATTLTGTVLHSLLALRRM